MRRLRRAPGFSIAVIATFALGVGINVAVFSSVDRLLYRPLPYRDPDRLFLLQPFDVATGQRAQFLPARFVAEARAKIDAIEDLAVLGDSNAFFETPEADGPEMRVSFVTSRMLDVGGVRPAVGRGFADEDNRGGRRVAVLMHDAWQKRFGGDPQVVGRRLWNADGPLEIIGVLPAGYIPSGAYIDPNAVALTLMPTPQVTVSGLQQTLAPTVRLKAGASPRAVQAALDALADALTPEMPRGSRPPAVRLVPIRDAMFGQYYQSIWLVVGGAALVLLVTCANLSALFLVRARSRLRDRAVRVSLGASRARLFAESVTESFVLCLAGSAAALIALVWSSRWLDAMLPPVFSRYSAGVDARVVAVAIVLAAVASLAAAILPALLLDARDVWPVIQGGSDRREGRSARRGRWLLTIEAAIGMVLVAAALVTSRNVSGLTANPLGFDPRDLTVLLVRLSAAQPADRYADLQRALVTIRSEPGVLSAGAGVPMVSVLRSGTAAFSADGPPCCRWPITGGYLASVGAPLLAGREISDADVTAGSMVAVLNEAGLRRVWPDAAPADAIGRALEFKGEPSRTVIGIVGDTRRGHDDDPQPGVFVPAPEAGSGILSVRSIFILARTRPGVPPLFSSLRPRVDVDGRRALLYVRPIAPTYSRVLEGPRFRAALFGAFGALALVVAMVGLYAVTSFDVACRRRELGVRLALGASGGAMQRMVLRQAGGPVLAGIAAGLILAIWAGSFLQSFLHRFDARDPWTLILSAMCLAAASTGAAWLPAWRAAHVDPVVALRE